MNWEKNLAEKIKFNDVDNAPAVVGNHLLSTFSNEWPLAVVDVKGTLIQKVLERPSSSIVVGDDKIFFGNMDGDLVVLIKNYTVLKKLPLTWAIRFVQLWKNFIVVTSVTGEVVAIDRQNYKIMKEFHAGGRQSVLFHQWT